MLLQLIFCIFFAVVHADLEVAMQAFPFLGEALNTDGGIMISPDSTSMYYLVTDAIGADVTLAEVSLDSSDFGSITRSLDLDSFGSYFCGIIVPDTSTAYILGGYDQPVLLQLDIPSFMIVAQWTLNLTDSSTNCQLAMSPVTNKLYFFAFEGFAELDPMTDVLRSVDFPDYLSAANHFVIDRHLPMIYWSSDPSGGDTLSREVSFDLEQWEVSMWMDFPSSSLYPQTNMYFGTWNGDYVMVYMSLFNTTPAINALNMSTLMVVVSSPLNYMEGFIPTGVAGYGEGGDIWMAFVSSTNSTEGMIMEWPVKTWNVWQSEMVMPLGNPPPLNMQEPPTHINELYFTGPSNDKNQPTLLFAVQAQK